MGKIVQEQFTYLGHLHQLAYSREAIDLLQISAAIDRFSYLGNQLSHIMPTFFVLDYQERTYTTISKNCMQITGYPAEQHIEDGIPFLLDIYQKEDFRLYDEHIYGSNLQTLQTIPQAHHEELVFSYNFRIKSKQKKEIKVYQRNAYITSKETGLPLYSVGFVTDITPIKSDAVMQHAIEWHHRTETGTEVKQILHHYYYPHEEDKVLSKREKEILNLMADGYSSKETAIKLSISEHTVINHRKNMLKKTNTKNIAELVAFAIRSKLI